MFSNLRDFGVVPFVRAETEEEALCTAQALRSGGLPIMELVFRTFAHSRAIRRIAREMPDFIIGAGNILNKDQLVRAIDSSARFAFSPGTEMEMVREACSQRIVFAPGVCTASNIQLAMLSGVTEFQFFPAEQSGGVKVLAAISEPFQHLGIEFFVKGGVTLENMRGYLMRREVVAVSAPWIAPPELVTAKDWKRIAENAAEAVGAVRAIRREQAENGR